MQKENSGFIQQRNTKIVYSTYGSGPALLICPVPWGVNNRKWETILSLSQFFTLIFVEPRGVGGSGPVADKNEYSITQLIKDIDVVREYLKIDSWFVMGQSAAGFTALEYTLAYPAKIKKLIIVCSSPTGFFHKGTIRDREHPRYNEVKDIAETFRKEFTAERFREYMKKVYTMDIQNPKALPEIEKVFGEADISIERYKYFATVELNRYNVIEKLSTIIQPTLIIAGKHDVHVSPSQSEIMHKKIPNSQYVLLEHCGHFPWLDDPNGFVKLVVEYLSR